MRITRPVRKLSSRTRRVLLESLEPRKLLSTTAFLSDLTPTAAYNGFGPMAVDASIGGHTLQINGTVYQKGFGTNAYSELDFDLPAGKYTAFDSDIGIDDETRGHGSVDFQVLLNGAVAYDSGLVTPGNPAPHVHLDLTGVTSLILVADSAGDGIANDHADWAGAQLTLADPPTAPSNLTATPTSPSEIDLAWTDNATAETGYRIDRSTDNLTFSPLTTLPADWTSYADTALTENTHYYYHVVAFNGVGDSSPPTAADATTPQTKPVAPTDLSAHATSPTSVDLSWTDAAFNESTYRVERSTDNATFTPLANLPAGTTTYTDTTAAESTHYYYRVFATNGAGDSDPSDTADVTTPLSPPAAPTNPAAHADSSSVIKLAWTDSATNESGYRIERSTDDVAFSPITTLPADATSYFDTGLTESTHYYYRIVAFNGAGDSGAATADATTLAVVGPPPTGPVTYLSDLPATAEFNGFGPVERDMSVGSRAAGDGNTLAIGGQTYAKGFGTNAYSELDFDLSAGQYVFFSADIGVDDETRGRGSVTFQVLLDNVLAFDSGTVTAGAARHVALDITGVHSLILVATNAGDGSSNDHADWADAKLISSPSAVTPPAAPTNLAATAASPSEIDLAWTDNATNETSYRIERSTDNVTFSPLATLPADSTSYSDTGLAGNTHYYYRVVASNSSGDSSPATADATTSASATKPAAPTDLTATADPSMPVITLSWTDAATDETGYRVERSTDGTTFAPVATLPANSNSYTDVGLPPATHFYYRVVATNAVGDSDPSSAADATTPQQAPQTLLAGTAIGTPGSYKNLGNELSNALDGDPNTFFDAPSSQAWVGLDLGTPQVISSVRFAPRRGWSSRMVGGTIEASVAESSWVVLYTIPAAPDQGTFTTVTLSDPTPYRYVRYVSPAGGWGNVAELEFYTTNTVAPAPPAAPTNPVATPVTPAQINLTWTDVATNESGYRVERSADNVHFIPVANLPANTTSFADTGLAAGTHYYYRIFAFNAVGTSSPPATADATTLPQTDPGGPPPQLSGTPIGTPGSYNNNGNDLTKALDGNPNTYFDGPSASGDFVGLDLGAPAVLTSVRIYPRNGFAKRMTGGSIQASLDGVTWTTLATLSDPPPAGAYTTLTVTDPTAYRYVRYLAPDGGWGNVAELEFYGLPATPPAP